jgi:hypothetical protein
MNPNLIGIVGMITSLLGMGSSLTSQAVNIHRELHPPPAAGPGTAAVPAAGQARSGDNHDRPTATHVRTGVKMNPPQVRTMSPAVRIILGGVLFVGTAIFIIALHRPARSPLADIKVSNDGWWLHERMPTSRPTPKVVATPTLKPIIVQQLPHPSPVSTPHVCQICMERTLRYYKAVATGMGGDVGNSIRVLPQAGQPSPMPSPSIFAPGA